MNAENRPVWVYLPIISTLMWAAVQTGLAQHFLGINQGQAIALMILILAALLWITEWVPLYLTSFVILLTQLVWLVPVLEPTSTKAARAKYLAPFFSEVILLFLGGFVLAAALHKFGLDKKLAGALLRRTGNSPGKVMLGFMVTSAFLSMWMSNTATTAMMFAILLPIAAKIPVGNPFAKGLAISIPFACNLGGLGTPIGTPPNAIALSYLASHGFHIGFAQWMAATLPFMLVFLLFVWLVLLKLYPAQGLSLELPPSEKKPLSATQWLVASIFGFTLLMWFFSGSTGLSVGTVSLFPVVILFGGGILKVGDFKQLPWDVLFMVGGGICLGVGLKQSGLTNQIVSMIPTDQQFWLVLMLFGVLAAVMTTFMSNTATANLLIPLAVSINHEVGLLVLTIALNCSTAMSLPVSTPPNAIAFSSGLLESKDMIRPGVAITLLSLVATLTLGALYWPQLNL